MAIDRYVYTQSSRVERKGFHSIGLPLLFTLFFLSFACTALAQERRGTLSNGMSYILRHNAQPRKKMEARLIMCVGSCAQRPDEAGYAHFIEHLAFGRTKHFASGGIKRYAERLGTRYGVGLNAMTGHDRTVYMVSLPTDEPHVLDSTALILSDWLTGLQLDSLEVEQERSIIKEEIRAYVQPDPFYALKVGTGIHSRSLPVGTAQDIDRATASGLRAFYHRWYRPSLATIVLVGDFDLDAAEKSLRATFTTAPTTPARTYIEPELHYPRGLHLESHSDTLIRTATLDLIFPHKTLPTRTLSELFTEKVHRMALAAWSHRLDKIRGAKLADSWYLGRTSHLSLTLEGSRTAEILRDLREAISALSVLRRGTISERELTLLKERAKSTLYVVTGDTPSAGWCDYYTDEILHGDHFLTDEAEKKELERRIDGLRASDLRPAFDRLYRYLAGPSKLASFTHNVQLPETARPQRGAIERAIQRGLSAQRTRLTFTPPSDEATEEKKSAIPQLLAPPQTLPAAELRSSKIHPDLGVQEAYLPNGIRIILRPLPEADSVVKIAINHPSGLRNIPLDEQPRVASLAAYMELGGIATLPREQLDSFLFDHGVALTLTEAMDWGALLGTAPTGKTYSLLRLMKEKMLHPEAATADFEESRESLISSLGRPSRLEQMLARDPERKLQRRLDSILGTYIPQREPETEAEARALSLPYMIDFHTDLWTRTEGMTIVVVGRFDSEALLKEISGVFADLPQRPAKPTLPSTGQPTAENYTLEDIDAGDETALHNVYYGTYEPTLRGSLRLKLMRELLRSRLIDRLRSEAGIIYSPYLYMEYRPKPEPFVWFRLETLVKSSNAPLACKLIEELVEDLQTKLASPSEIADIARTFLINKREALTESDLAPWQDTLLGLVRSGERLEDFAQYEQILRSITPEELRTAFRTILSPQRHLIYSIVPKQ